jgi:molybdopterin-binding protein
MIKGKVLKVERGAVNSEVVLEVPGGIQIVAVITNGSVDSLGLETGKEAYAVIKASSVMVAVD